MQTIVDQSPGEYMSPNEPPQYVTADGQPNVALLRDRTPPWARASSRTVWLALCLGVLFIYRSYVPLWPSDLWGHLSYGRWIVANRALPTTEPLLPLARGVPCIDTAWLSQLLGYGAIRVFDVFGIQFLYALSITLTTTILAATVMRRTHSLAAGLLAFAIFSWGTSWQLLVVRPQLAGMLCFVAVFAMATGARWSRWKTWAIPATFVLWANLHGSFIMGLALLGMLIAGRAVDVWRRTGKLRFRLLEQNLLGLILVAELSAVAVLLNPYGIAIYPEVLSIANNPNLEQLHEWDPLTLRMQQGQMVAVTILGLLALHRVSRRRVTFQEIFVLVGLATGMFWHLRMIIWWFPVAAYYVGLHAASAWHAWRPSPRVAPATGGLWSVVVVGIMWICFAVTPFGVRAMHGAPQDAEIAAKKVRAALHQDTPVNIVGYLRDNPPQGQVFNNYEWGDYLLWAGPPDVQVFVNSHVHLVPREVWYDYFLIGEAQSGWEDKLDRYGVNVVVADHARHTALLRELSKSANWEERYSDAQGAVFWRKRPI